MRCGNQIEYGSYFTRCVALSRSEWKTRSGSTKLIYGSRELKFELPKLLPQVRDMETAKYNLGLWKSECALIMKVPHFWGLGYAMERPMEPPETFQGAREVHGNKMDFVSVMQVYAKRFNKSVKAM